MFVLRTVRKVECCPPPVLGVRGPLGSNLGGVRTTIQKHWNPNFKKLRRQKVLKIDLPDYQQLERPVMEIPKEEIRSRMKERGIVPSRYWPERPFYIASTSQIFEPYVPPEGDGKVSVISSQGAKQKLEFVEKKGKSMLALRKIRNYDEEFDSKVFAKEAQEVYIQAHKAMTNKERDKLHQFVTERAYPEIVSNVGDKTLIWQFLQSIEPPRVVHLRCTDVITKENIYAQVTVRFHTQQIMAVYDRFGRLMHGNETIPKDVLEYVVFEKHLASQYGRWRVHDKIIPDWMPPREPSKKTYCETAEEEEEVAALPAQQQTSAPATV